MVDLFSESISILALATSVSTLWLTFLRKGSIRMTQPTTIYFGPDGPKRSGSPSAKVYIRMLLFASSKRGRVVESMFVVITRNESR
jgi:hypothetical protein